MEQWTVSEIACRRNGGQNPVMEGQPPESLIVETFRIIKFRQ